MAARFRVHTLQSTLRLRLSFARVAPLAIFGATFLLYLATLTQVHTFDALSYVTTVERKPWTEVFHPHHLVYGPLGALALALGQALGFSSGAALPMQLINAFAGALGVALFFALTRHATGRADAALAAAMLLGGAYAYWYYAVEVEVYTVAALFLMACLWILIGLNERSSPRRMALLGLAQGGAILFHQTNVLLCAPIMVFCLLQGARRPTIKASLAYLVTLVLTAGLPYLFVGVVSGFRNWGDFEGWLTEYARTGWWGGPITAQKWADLGQGLADTLAQPGGALLGLLLIGLVVLHLRCLSGVGVLVGTLLAWLLTYGTFFLWWEPDNVEFWIASLPPALLLLALALRGARPWGAELWIALAAALTALALNHDSIVRRGDATTDLQRTIARALAAHSQPADLLVIPDGLLELYLPYYEQREAFISLNQALFDSGGNWERACAAVRSRVETALHAGAAAIIADEALDPPTLLLRRHQLTSAQVAACFEPYRALFQPLALGAGLPRYWRLPTGQEQADRAGWRFTDFDEGWQAQNIDNQRFEGGWRFTPGSDPALISSLLRLDTQRYRAIEIRIANATQARDAQLFFAGPDGTIDEKRSVRWTLQQTADATTYRIELAGRPGWQGVVTRLRLDPVGVGDGGELRVESVRLLAR